MDEIKEEINKDEEIIKTADAEVTESTQNAEKAENTEATEETESAETAKKNGRLLFYFAIACTSLGGLFFGLTFTPLAVYSLLAAILFCLVSLSLLDTQKKRENFKGVFILTVITYSIMGIFIVFLIGGVIWSLVA